MTVTYEWYVAALDADGEITESSVALSYRGATQIASQWKRHSIELMRTDEHERGFAAVANGRLPEVFGCGHRVPRRFHLEILS